jgi:2-C-methyl-D-erythritol 2,4-cyclodiphosphate synthase
MLGGVALRIGHGYDVHRLVENRKLIMGGVEIPYSLGLLGHSDADVLVHAIMDALLGAAALGDIGKHFPDNDDNFKGADSIYLLTRVRDLLYTKGYNVINIDATIIAQAPKMAPHIEYMRINISRALNISIEGVNVKATTEEGLGFSGRGEGIAAHAVCLLSGGTA